MLLEVYANIADSVAHLLHRWNYRLYDAEATAASRRESATTFHNTLAIPR